MKPLPPEITKLVALKLGDDSAGVLREMTTMWNAGQSGVPRSSYGIRLAEAERKRRKRPPRGEKTTSDELGMGSMGIYDIERLGTYNPNDVTMDQIGLMRKNGMVRFVLAMRAMPIIGLFRNEPGEGWEIEADDEEVKAVITAALRRIIKDLVKGCQTARAYGFFAAEKVFSLVTYEELGVEDQPGDRVAWIYDKVKGNHPKTVTLMRNRKTDKFEGYTQGAQSTNPIRLKANKAFVYSYHKEFGNLYGDPDTTAMFAPWYWLEFTWRALLRYLERQGTPVAVAYAPQGEKVEKEDHTEEYALDRALYIAMDIAKSNAAALPSDNFPADDGGGKKWALEYLVSPERADQFAATLDALCVELMRAGGIPEKAAGVSSPGETGAYAAWKVPSDMFMMAEEEDLSEFVQHVNRYLLPPLGRYNFGEEWFRSGRIRLVTKGLDQAELDRLLETIKALFPTGHPDIQKIDMEAMLGDAGIPTRPAPPQEPSSLPPSAKGPPGTPQPAPGVPPQEQAQAGEEGEQTLETVRSMMMSAGEMARVLAERQVEEKGAVTITGESLEEAAEKAYILQQAGIAEDTPVQILYKRRDTFGQFDPPEAGRLAEAYDLTPPEVDALQRSTWRKKMAAAFATRRQYDPTGDIDVTVGAGGVQIISIEPGGGDHITRLRFSDGAITHARRRMVSGQVEERAVTKSPERHQEVLDYYADQLGKKVN